MIALNWSVDMHCQRKFATGKALIRALALEDDFDGDLDTVTDEQAIEFVHSSMEGPGLVGDFLEEWSADGDFVHSVEADLDGAEALVVES